MKRAVLTAAAVAVVCVFASTAGAADSSRPQVVESKGPAYPVKTYVLTLPSNRKLTAGDVHVTENGGAVADETVVPAAKANKQTFGTVLVLDTSYSMLGKPVAAAVKAEQAFADQRNPNAKLGLIEFNRDTKQTLGLTTKSDDISAALAKPPQIKTGTHLYDAVAAAEQMLTNAHIGAGSIVVLSDGADTGSTKTLQQVAGNAVVSGTKIYTIGLADKSYNAHTLKTLANATHGEYAQASAQNLSQLFDQLGKQISNEYLLQYKSLLGPDKKVVVLVNVNGVGRARPVGYTTPALPPSAKPAPYNPSIGTRILDSTWLMILLALVIAGAIALVVIALLQPKRSGLPGRMAEFVSIRSLQKDKGEAVEETSPGKKEWWTRFEETLEIAEIKIEPEWIVAGTIVGTLLTFLLIYLATGSVWWALFAFVIPYLVREWVLRTLARKRNKFAEQLPDALQVIGSALRSGHSFAGALAVVVESASEPMKSEMQRVVADEQLGIPIQDSLNVVAKRMASRDVEQLALVAQLQREAGGDAAEVIDTVAATVRERFDLKRLIQTLTMQGRMSRWIVSALPIVVILAVKLENPSYFHPLTSTLGGRIILILAAAWAVAGSFVIKHIVEIEV